MEVGRVAAQLGALQAGRGGGSRKGKETTEEVRARGGRRLKVDVGNDGGGGDRVGWKTAAGGDAQHVVVVVGEGGDEPRAF